MHKIIDYLFNEIDRYEDKLDRTGELSRSDLECGDMQAHFLKSLLTCEAMLNSSYSRGNENGGYSNARRRDSMGRYMDGSPSNGGSYTRPYARSYDDRSMDNGYSGRRYSRDEGRSEMTSHLENLMNKASTPEERKVIQSALEQIENM